jgi:hypothetical protein
LYQFSATFRIIFHTYLEGAKPPKRGRRLSWDYQFSGGKYSMRKLPGDVISYPRGREVGCDSYLGGWM